MASRVSFSQAVFQNIESSNEECPICCETLDTVKPLNKETIQLLNSPIIKRLIPPGSSNCVAHACQGTSKETKSWHAFHKDCFVQALHREQKCALCRSQVTACPTKADLDAIAQKALRQEAVNHARQREEDRRLIHDAPQREEDRRLIHAARDGERDLVEQLLGQEEFSTDTLTRALLDAVRDGHFDIGLRLVQSGQIFQHTRITVLLPAIQGGHLGLVQALLTGSVIPRLDLGRLVEAATEHGHLEIVQALIGHGEISEFDRMSSLCSALQQGRTLIAHALLPTEPLVTPSSLTLQLSAVTLALQTNDLSTAEALLLARMPIPERIRDHAFFIAKRCGHIDHIQQVLANYDQRAAAQRR